jgi:hypothetical protein
MEKLSAIFVGGLAGGVIFLIAMYLMRAFKITTANPIHTLGSFFSDRQSTQTILALIIFFSGALLFAFVDSFLLTVFPVENFFMLIFIGAFIGFAHGLVVTLATANIAAPRHPLPEYQTLPFPAGLSYVIAHVLFGMSMGFAIGMG